MRVPLSWLKDYVDINLPVEEVDRLLTNAGLEVKTIDTIGLPGAELEWEADRVVLGQILKVEQHPNADRLVLATVEYGAAETEIVVTGAPNLFQYIGEGDLADRQLYSAYALEGATLYDGHQEGWKKTKLKGRSLRGVYNRSMLCSEKELGISEEHDGIIIIEKDENSPDYKAGTPLADLLGDVVLEIDIIPNIARCSSMVGVAREYAALTGQPVRYPSYDVLMEGPDANARVQVRTENPELNPRFAALIIDGIEQKPSPYWMQHRLRLAGQRPISVVVDISNYVMLEMGQPNHTFDYDFLRRRADQYAPDGPIEIITRLPHEGETLVTLDGVTHKLQPHNILVTDPLSNLSVGGVMGGAESEIKPETTRVLLEAAAWNFINIRKTATQLGIHTEAAFRFSRGVHPSQALLGAKRAAELLRRLAGGTVAHGIIDSYPLEPAAETITLNVDYVRRLSGLDLSAEEIAILLGRLEFDVKTADSQHLLVTAPDHRLDIEGAHDLVEEVCRMYGYGRIPSTALSDDLPPQRGNPALEQEERIKDILVQAGVQEIIGVRLTSREMEALMIPRGIAPAVEAKAYVTITNPNSPERVVMRQTLLAGLLEATASNSRFQERIALFEVGPVFLVEEGQQLPNEQMRLALVLTGQRAVSGWQDGKAGLMDFFDLKGILERLFNILHVEITYEAAEHPSFRPGRTAKVRVGKTVLGFMGELHPSVVEAFAVRVEPKQGVMAADLNLNGIISRIPALFPFKPIHHYPAVREDLALVVSADTAASEVEAVIKHVGGFLLQSVQLFDLYEGGQIAAGQKSLAYHLVFQSPSKTLTDSDVRRQRERILKQLEKQIGARLRE